MCTALLNILKPRSRRKGTFLSHRLSSTYIFSFFSSPPLFFSQVNVPAVRSTNAKCEINSTVESKPVQSVLRSLFFGSVASFPVVAYPYNLIFCSFTVHVACPPSLPTLPRGRFLLSMLCMPTARRIRLHSKGITRHLLTQFWSVFSISVRVLLYVAPENTYTLR